MRRQLSLRGDPSQPTGKRVTVLKDIVKTNPRRFKSHANLLGLLQTPEKQIRIEAVNSVVQLDFFEASALLKEAYVHEADAEVLEQIRAAIGVLDIL